MESLKERIIVVDDKTLADFSKLYSSEFNNGQIKKLCLPKHLNSSDRQQNFKIRCAKDPMKVHYFAPKIKDYIKSGKICMPSENLNPLFHAVYLAYTYHIPLILSPDHIWLAIIQGLSNHIKENSEELRGKFVNFKGKKDLSLKRPDFVYGSSKNDWDGVINDFNEQMKENLNEDFTKSFYRKFSTTTKIEATSYNIAIMDAMQNYFKFTLYGGCTMTKVKLLGNVVDWQIIRTKAENLKKYELGWWSEYLLPILDKLLKAFEGEDDKIFWNCIMKRAEPSGSGSRPFADGWIFNFFPYLHDEFKGTYYKNPGLQKIDKFLKFAAEEEEVAKVDVISKLPDGLSSVPFNYVDLLDNGKEHTMRFSAGFVGCEFDGEFIKPAIGWCVTELNEI